MYSLPFVAKASDKRTPPSSFNHIFFWKSIFLYVYVYVLCVCIYVYGLDVVEIIAPLNSACYNGTIISPLKRETLGGASSPGEPASRVITHRVTTGDNHS